MKALRSGIQDIALHRLDIITSILGLVGGVLIMSLYLKSPTAQLLILGGALFSASLIYLILSRTKYIGNDLVNFCSGKYSRYLLEYIFLFFLVVSIVAFYSSGVRTIFYFIIVSFCAGIVALLCINATKKMDIIIQIVNIILLSLTIKLTKFYFFGGSGVDYWVHLKMNEMLSQLGNIEILTGKEEFFPIMHINVAISQIVPGLNGKDASMFSIIIPLVISSICIYLICRESLGENIGLLGMLLVNISDFHNSWGFAPQTTSYGVIIFFFLIFVLSKLKRTKNKIKWLIIIFILMFTMITAHAVSSFILFITLIGLITGSLIYSKLFSEKRESFSPVLITIYFIGFMQLWFITDYRKDGVPFFEQISGSLFLYITGYAGFLNRPEGILEYEGLLPSLAELLMDNLGMALLIFLATIGSLYWLSSDFRSEENFSSLFCTILLMSITFMFPLFGIRNIIPSRWFVFEYFFLAIMASFATIQLARRMSKNQQICVIFVFYACLSFFMLTSTSNNLDSPFWLKESTISTTYTVQEIEGAELISRYSDEAFSDSRYGSSILGSYYGLQKNALNSRDLTNRAGDVFVWRNYMADRPIRMFKKIEGYDKWITINVILGSGYKEALVKMHKVCENDDIAGYYIRGTNN